MKDDDPAPPSLRQRPVRRLGRQITTEEAALIFSTLRRYAAEQQRAKIIGAKRPPALLATGGVAVREDSDPDPDPEPVLHSLRLHRGMVLFAAVCIAAGAGTVLHGEFLDAFADALPMRAEPEPAATGLH